MLRIQLQFQACQSWLLKIRLRLASCCTRYIYIKIVWSRIQDSGVIYVQHMGCLLPYNLLVCNSLVSVCKSTYLEQTCVRIETLLVLLAVEVKRSKIEQAVGMPWLNIECSYIERLRLYKQYEKRCQAKSSAMAQFLEKCSKQGYHPPMRLLPSTYVQNTKFCTTLNAQSL
jgi:hypothetical protein